MIASLKITLFLCLSLVTLHVQGQSNSKKQVDEGYIKGNTYHSKEIGWSIQIPNDWEIVSNESSEANDQRGKEAIEKSTGLQIDVSTLKHLISFKKDIFNNLSSTTEPFKEEYTGEYEENCKAVNDILYQTFTDNGIKTDSSSGKAIIQGLEFQTYHSILYAPGGEIVMQQMMYSRLINGYDFSVNINYNNEADKKTMTDVWEKSVFITPGNKNK